MKKKLFGFVLLISLLVTSFSGGVFAAENPNAEKDIVDTAVAAGQFNTLAAALQKAGLVETLKGKGPFTVFAPTDEAFAKLLKDLNITAEELLAREDLKDILLYHVVPGKVLSTDLKDGMKVKTVSGKEVTISLDPVQVNKSNVVKADVLASNGVIHVIDAVLLPQ
ncbi:fasciclin domain-containing protein [Bacillus suaedaesalsae]|uniref:Fasciclin domain-containing protein n=1 Tax=Bacillus suaedaesalsae TaxID=2810349 RepID=A0ABS2DMF1_9BACI|nr:fasciclin domain-containing protein [Bacillus suaedaesalsae]MBM6619652.1 fasciclin domain-containing protein [Bacillus suaedaesalsae]